MEGACGSKRIPEDMVTVKQSLSLAKEALGVASATSGLSGANENYSWGKFMGFLSLEKHIGGLANQGIQSRSSMLQLEMQNAGCTSVLPAGATIAQAGKMAAVISIVVYQVDLVLKIGSCEVRE